MRRFKSLILRASWKIDIVKWVLSLNKAFIIIIMIIIIIIIIIIINANAWAEGKPMIWGSFY